MIEYVDYWCETCKSMQYYSKSDSEAINRKLVWGGDITEHKQLCPECHNLLLDLEFSRSFSIPLPELVTRLEQVTTEKLETLELKYLAENSLQDHWLELDIYVHNHKKYRKFWRSSQTEEGFSTRNCGIAFALTLHLTVPELIAFINNFVSFSKSG
jgi:hypothetical protein